MVAKVRELDEEKLFKITKFNLGEKAQDCYHRFDPIPNDWETLQTLFLQKYGIYDEHELRLKMDVVQ
jgi:hypothetical protein